MGAGNHPVSVKAFNMDGCFSADTLMLNIKANPVVNLGNDSTLCEGNHLLFAGNGAQSYAWSTGGLSAFEYINSYDYPEGNQQFSVLVTGQNGCKTADTIVLTFSHIAAIDLGMDTVLCKDQVVVLDAGNGYQSYLWSTGSSNQTITIDSLIGLGTHQINVKANNIYGCWTMDTILVTYNNCMGIEDRVGEDNIQLYPNPTTGIVYLQVDDFESIEVIDVNGKVVKRIMEGGMQKELVKIDLTMMENGVYIIRVKRANYSIERKKILQ